MGARVVKVSNIAQLEGVMEGAKTSKIPVVIVIDTDPAPGTGAGGAWWEVAVPEVSTRREVNEARAEYDMNIARQWIGN